MHEYELKQNTFWQNFVLFLSRWTVAIIFLLAAYAKLPFWSNPPFELGASMLNLTKFLSIVEPLGALALIMGFLTRWAAAGLAIIMVGAIVVLNLTMGTSFFTSLQGVGWDYNLLILIGCLVLAAFGAGTWSLDALRKQV